MEPNDPTLNPEPSPRTSAQPTEQPAEQPASSRMGIRRIAGSLVLAAGLLGIGGASVVLAASPSPSASTTPSTTQPSGGTHQGAMPGGCTHSGTSGSSGSSGTSSPSSSG
jgi:hypothetical protein